VEWAEEKIAIREAAERYGVDARFIATIRKVENGGPGREFGVLSVSAPDYAGQLKEACISVAHRLFRYQRDRPSAAAIARGYTVRTCSCGFVESLGGPVPSASALAYTLGGLRYSEAFIIYFAGIWAPVLAPNDPAHLNEHWLTNALAIYDRACGGEGLDGLA
jgi:hypothetical protein